MREKPWFAVAYMFAVTAFFSFIVIGLARVTAERVRRNEQLAFERAVLMALQMAQGKTAEQIHQTFVEMIEPVQGENNYGLIRDGELAAYAVGFSGRGFWAPIRGVIGIEPDRQTVIGIAFYDQKETPGLGGEIVGQTFRRQFENLKLNPGPRPIEFRPFGATLDSHQVHAITGATQTCTRLEHLMNEDINEWLRIVAQEDTK